jgi:recombination protein RecA
MAGIEDLVASLQKKFGKEVIAGNNQQGVEFISSGSLSLDLALGGGYPKGRIIEIRGYESSGKTTLALTACREAQQATGKAVAYIDKENAIDMDYVEAIGVDISANKFLLFQPGTAEECLEIIRELIKSKEICAVVMDSVAAMFPKCYLDADVGDAKMGVLARLMSAWLPGFTKDLADNGIIMLFINQFREKIGIAYGNPTTTPGGKALGFYTSQVLEVTKAGTLGERGEETANHVKVKVAKNKVAPPLRKAEFDIRFGEGIDKASELIQIGVDKNIIQKAGAFYKYKGKNIGQGAERARETLIEDENLMAEIESEIVSIL